MRVLSIKYGEAGVDVKRTTRFCETDAEAILDARGMLKRCTPIDRKVATAAGCVMMMAHVCPY